MRYKDLWFAEFERQYNEADGPDGVSDKVYDELSRKATFAVNERLTARADERRKEDD